MDFEILQKSYFQNLKIKLNYFFMTDGYKKFKGGLVSGITLLTIGLVFLLDNLGLVDISLTWPIIPIGIGIGMMIRYFLSRKEA